MRTGELGRRAGVRARALRHYEELGLLPARSLRAGHPTGSSCPAAPAVHRRKLAEVDDRNARLHAVRGETVAQMYTAAPRCGFTEELS